MKKDITRDYFKQLVIICLLGLTTMANAAPASGTWNVKLWNDVTGLLADSWNICLQKSGEWYVADSRYPGVKGKWFSKGNESHLQAMHSTGTAANSFSITQINSQFLTGYYMTLDNAGSAGYYTVTIQFKSLTCPAYIP